MIENFDWIFAGIGATLIALLLGWLFPWGMKRVRVISDGQKIYKWLEMNTSNERGKSHKTLHEISVGTRLSENRVREACLQNKKILHSVKHIGSYSIWQSEPHERISGVW